MLVPFSANTSAIKAMKVRAGGGSSYVKEDTEKEEEMKDLELLDEPTENAEEKTEDVDMQILDDEETPKE